MEPPSSWGRSFAVTIATRSQAGSPPPEVAANDHPFYKHVTLRLIPIGGGPARVIAYLYGGQGTMNVPSWSPDGKRLAFVSNSSMP